MDCWQLTIASSDRRHAFADHAVRLVVVHVLVRIAGPVALLWCVVDDHLHLVVACTRAEAGRLAQRLSLALAAAVPEAGLDPARICAVQDRRHLYTLVPYVLTQTWKHGLPGHPGRWEASCFADLIGARVLSGYDPRPLTRALPRLTEREILDAVEVPPAAIRPFEEGRLDTLLPADLVAAAASAVGVPDLSGSRRPVVEAKRVVARFARGQGWPTVRLAELLGVHPASARRFATAVANPRVERAFRRQLTLRASVPAERRTAFAVPEALPGGWERPHRAR